jgi:hypothetical protein
MPLTWHQTKQAEGTSPAGGPEAAAQWPPTHPLPLFHDWTGVVDLSPHSFFTINTDIKEELKGGNREKEERNIEAEE